MLKRISADEFATDLMNDRYASWTRAQAFAIFDYLENIDEDTTYDVTTIRCSFDAYDDITQFNIDFSQGYETLEAVAEDDDDVIMATDGTLIVDRDAWQ